MDKQQIKQKILDNVKIVASPDGRFKDCWYYTKNNNNHRYNLIYIEGKHYVVHRVMAWIYELKDPEGNLFTLGSKYKICHKCDYTKCINLNHLFVGTMKNNSDDMISKNRQKHSNGENHGLSKLKNFQIVEIRENKENLIQKKLAEKYCISQSQISKIKNNKIWN